MRTDNFKVRQHLTHVYANSSLPYSLIVDSKSRTVTRFETNALSPPMHYPRVTVH